VEVLVVAAEHNLLVVLPQVMQMQVVLDLAAVRLVEAAEVVEVIMVAAVDQILQMLAAAVALAFTLLIPLMLIVQRFIQVRVQLLEIHRMQIEIMQDLVLLLLLLLRGLVKVVSIFQDYNYGYIIKHHYSN
jgi:hypothetical protein